MGILDFFRRRRASPAAPAPASQAPAAGTEGAPAASVPEAPPPAAPPQADAAPPALPSLVYRSEAVGPEELYERADDARAPQAAAVLADWLQSRGDPRGELAALLQAGREQEASAYLAEHAPALLGPLAGPHKEGGLRGLQWRHGFLVGAELRASEGEAIRELSLWLGQRTSQLLALPLARFLTNLTLRFPTRFPWQHEIGSADSGDAVEALLASSRASALLSLTLGDKQDFEAEATRAFLLGRHDWSRLRALRSLTVCARGAHLGVLDLPELRHLARFSDAMSRVEVPALLRSALPRLESLELGLGGGSAAIAPIRVLTPFLDGRLLATVRHFGAPHLMVANPPGQLLLPALLQSAVLPRLETLDLSHGVLDDVDGRALLAAVPRLRHLERLDLSRNFLRKTVEPLRAALPRAVLSDQRG